MKRDYLGCSELKYDQVYTIELILEVIHNIHGNTQHNEISFSETLKLDDELEINFYLLREENEQEKESRLRKEANREAAKKEERRVEYLVLKKEFGE